MVCQLVLIFGSNISSMFKSISLIGIDLSGDDKSFVRIVDTSDHFNSIKLVVKFLDTLLKFKIQGEIT